MDDNSPLGAQLLIPSQALGLGQEILDATDGMLDVREDAVNVVALPRDSGLAKALNKPLYCGDAYDEGYVLGVQRQVRAILGDTSAIADPVDRRQARIDRLHELMAALRLGVMDNRLVPGGARTAATGGLFGKLKRLVGRQA